MDYLSDAALWRKRAAQTRARIGTFHDRNSSVNLLRVAEEYERLAERAENLHRGDDASHDHAG
ncbi:hypothetical protein [Bradyrhizobium sp. CCBAU 51745]|uniref:hypothetical protein n=1 Tax=Bradyrhizobium sp. CCBAU 51745 TaxID=1325099 RepID=UPI002304F65E|nr:hypothetical protein [Bradyrhizobium sp. CCBAU 51745]